MAQELTSGLGRPLTWRDKLRNHMREQYGDQGAQFAEGLIGVSEEEQQMRYLQKRYGSELPEDAELDRSMRERLTDPSDIGGIDKLLMILSGTGSVAPRLATAASATESGTLLADAQGSYKKGDTLGAGLQTGLALLPAGLSMLGRGASPTTTKGIGDIFPKQQPEVSMAGTPYTMSVPDEPLYFSRQTGRMGGGGGGMDNKLTKFEGESPNERLKNWVITDDTNPNFADLQKSNMFDDNWETNFYPARKALKDEYGGTDPIFDPTIPDLDDGLEEAADIATAGRKSLLPEYGLTPKDVQVIDPEGTDAAQELIDLVNESNFVKDLGEEIKLYEIDGLPVVRVRSYDPDWHEFTYVVPRTKVSRLTSGRTRLDEIETDEISSLKNELYQKEAIRQREYSTMAPKSLSKLDNEIGKLKAQINALTGK